jgi:hypothetical protein
MSWKGETDAADGEHTLVLLCGRRSRSDSRGRMMMSVAGENLSLANQRLSIDETEASYRPARGNRPQVVNDV